MEEAEHLHLAMKREKRQCVCVCMCLSVRLWECEGICMLLLASSLSHPDPFQVHCIVSLIYVAPHLHLPTMSTL